MSKLYGLWLSLAVALASSARGADSWSEVQSLTATDELSQQDIGSLRSAESEQLLQWARLLPRLKSDERVRFIRKLEIVQNEDRTIPLLTSILKDGAEREAAHAAASLARMGRRVCPELLRVMNSEAVWPVQTTGDSSEASDERRTFPGRAAWILISMEDDCGLELSNWLRQFMADPGGHFDADWTSRRREATSFATFVFVKRKSNELQLLEVLARDSNDAVRDLGVSVMLLLPRTDSVATALRKLVSELPASQLPIVAGSLVEDRASVSQDELREWAVQGEGRMRALAISHLHLTEEQIDPVLLAAASDSDRLVRAAALRRLALQPLASPWLITWLSESEDLGLRAFTMEQMPDMRELREWLTHEITQRTEPQLVPVAALRLCKFTELPPEAVVALAGALTTLPPDRRGCIWRRMLALEDKTSLKPLGSELLDQLTVLSSISSVSRSDVFEYAALLVEIGERSEEFVELLVRQILRFAEQHQFFAAQRLHQLTVEHGLIEGEREARLIADLTLLARLEDFPTLVKIIRTSRLQTSVARNNLASLLRSGVSSRRIVNELNAINEARKSSLSEEWDHEMAVDALVQALVALGPLGVRTLGEELNAPQSSLFTNLLCKRIRRAAESGAAGGVENGSDQPPSFVLWALLKQSKCSAQSIVYFPVEIRPFVKAFRRALSEHVRTGQSQSQTAVIRKEVVDGYVAIAAQQPKNEAKFLLGMLDVVASDEALASQVIEAAANANPDVRAMRRLVESASMREVGFVTDALVALSEEPESSDKIQSLADTILEKMASDDSSLRQWLDSDPDGADRALSNLFELRTRTSRCSISDVLVQAVLHAEDSWLRLTMVNELERDHCVGDRYRDTVERLLGDNDLEVADRAASALLVVEAGPVRWERLATFLIDQGLKEEMQSVASQLEEFKVDEFQSVSKWAPNGGWNIGTVEEAHYFDSDEISLDAITVTGSRVSRGLPEGFWPPPPFATYGLFGSEFDLSLLGSPDDPLSTVHHKLVNALRSVDRNYESALFAAPGGFAMVVKSEQTAEDGTPLAAKDRWKRTLPPPSSLRDFLVRVFIAPPGHYRTIAFAFTDRSTIDTKEGELPNLEAGIKDLPEEVGEIRLGDRNAFCLVFAFVRRDGGLPKLRKEVSAFLHLERSGIAGQLRSGNRITAQ